MMTQPAHDRLDRTPTWRVQSVFDPDGGGSDFAYTIGLHDQGLPELHLWGRPDRGDDPGDDWLLSPHDRAHLLNELAWKLVDGVLPVGWHDTRAYDDGLATVDLRVGPPGDRDRLEAFGTHPDATVLPVSWALVRPAEGPLAPVTGTALAGARLDHRTIRQRLRRDARAPRGWALPRRASYAPGQRFGPLTPVVLARAAELWQADAAAVERLLNNAVEVRMSSGSVTFPAAVAHAVARPVGRRPAVDRVHEAAHGLVDWFTTHPDARPRWDAVLALIWGDHEHEPRRAEAGTRDLLLEVVETTLMVEVVADVVPATWLLQSRGAWASALVDRPWEETVPGLAASAGVLAAVVELLTPLDLDTLLEVSGRHDDGQLGSVDLGDAWREVVLHLRCWSVTSAAACPWAGTLAELPVVRDFVEAVARSGVTLDAIAPLQDWASCLTSAITHRARLTSAEVAAFCAPFRDLVPHLEATLNRPVVSR